MRSCNKKMFNIAHCSRKIWNILYNKDLSSYSGINKTFMFLGNVLFLGQQIKLIVKTTQSFF